MGGKDDTSPKAVSKRIKAAGLQKLRWYCQMCGKQCRDENGFKNHCTSESHLRQMRLFAEDKDQFIESYSRLFEQGYLETLKQRHGTTRIKANRVYQEYISDRHHVHMNATKWLTLSNFVKYLGRTGQCVVDQTPKGWFITLIDRDPAKAQREMEKRKKEGADLDAGERLQKQMEEQLEFIKAHILIEEHQATELQRAQGEPAVKFEMKDFGLRTRLLYDTRGEGEEDGDDDDDDGLGSDGEGGDGKAEDDVKPEPSTSTGAVVKAEPSAESSAVSSSSTRPRMSFVQMVKESKKEPASSSEQKVAVGEPPAKKAKPDINNTLDAILSEQMAQKERRGRRDYWLHPGIIVKIVNKTLGGGKYYKAKGEVLEVVEKYGANIRVLQSEAVVRIDQAELETVIPALGGRVLVVNGAFRGEVAELLAVHEDRFCADLKVAQGTQRGRLLANVAYEDFCKLAEIEPS
eukprot:RCo032930